MHGPDWKQQVNELHRESYLWSLCCCNYDTDLAKDVLQAVYLKIYEGRASFHERSKLRTWLFSVIRNTSVDVMRKRRVQTEPLKEVHQQIPTPLIDGANDKEPLFMNIPQNLSAQQREVLTLAFYHNLTLEEISALMEISIGTVRTHYERGKENFKKLLIKSSYPEFL